ANEFEGSKSNLDLDVKWAGSPYDWSLQKVEGKIHIDLDEGRIRDVDPGKAGRIFGLLSLRAIPRRLSLDFSDLFKKGFTFDSIRGEFSIDKGNAYTNNLVVKSPAGLIVIAGRIGLADEDYDQTLTYTPTLSGSFAVAGAVAGGPLGAAIAVLTEKLFRKQISKVSNYQYSVVGPWKNPVIKPIEVDTSENKKPLPAPIEQG
ncbi:MAG: TIGR02099 family protein, partial [Gammaproteobacteria bacterium]|nr:TIGR02099 family protein [Gammaproteobacteria bacterium]